MSQEFYRAYSCLTVKGIDGERRVITGTASTPEVDRMGDVVVPEGARFARELPLLLFHDTRLPVGTVRLIKGADGIGFEAHLPDISEPDSLRDRIAEAWGSIKAGLIKGVSIGFRTLDDGVERMKSGGLKFTGYEILELSLVAVPANASASIQTIKSFDAAYLAASGNGDGHSPNTPSVMGTHATAHKGARHMTIHDKKVAFEAEKAAKLARMNELMSGADAGASLDEGQQQEFDGLDTEVKAIESHLARLDRLEEVNKANAKPVAQPADPQAASAARNPYAGVVTVGRDNIPAGIGFARAVMCQVHARMDGHNVLEVAKARYPDHGALHNFLNFKAVVPAGTSTQAVYAGPLVYATNLASEFVEFLQPQTILGKFGTGGIPSLTRVPFNVRVGTQTSDANADWVQQGAGKPVTSAAFSSISLSHHKVATIAVLTKELVRLSTPSAEMLVRNALANAIIRKIDDSFIDPSFAAVANVNPASITYGLVALTSAGTSADNVRTDLGNILEQYLAGNQDPTGLVFILPPTLAMVLSLMRNSLGQKEFPDVNAMGGFLEGFPVITSQHAANSSGAGNLVIAVRAADIFLADDGAVSIDASEQASVQMSDAPTNNSATGTGASLVSLWQTNSVGIRAERELTWAKARSGAVVYMDDVNWGSIGSPA